MEQTDQPIPPDIEFDPKSGEPMMTSEAKKNMDEYLAKIDRANQAENAQVIQQMNNTKRAPEWLVFEDIICNTFNISYLSKLSDGMSIRIKFADGSDYADIPYSKARWEYLQNAFTFGVTENQNTKVANPNDEE